MGKPTLSSILKESENLLALAKKSAWLELEEFSIIRQKNIESFFASPHDHEFSSVAKTIDKIQKIDEQVLQLIKQSKSSAIADALKLQSSRNAINQYQKTGS